MAEFESTAWQVIEAAGAGDERARAEFARRYRSGIEDLLRARWRGTAREGHLDDAVQEVFVECLKEGGVLGKADRTSESGFRPFLRTIVRHVASRYEARDRREADRCDRAAPPPSQHASPWTSVSRVVDRGWARDVLRAAAAEHARRAAELGGAAQLRLEILRLRFEAVRPVRAIAEDLELEPAYVHHQLAKAKRDFHRALLRVLRRRRPDADDDALDAECRGLMELLG